MSQINDKDSNEFNNFYVEEVIKSKESLHETGEYNEIKILNGLISNAEEEEDSSSDKEESTSKTVAIGTTVGMTVGIGGVVIGAIASITLSLNFLAAQSVVGITQAQCYFELTNANYNEIDIQLEDTNGEKIQLVDLEPTETKNQYVAEFNHLSPNSTYFVKGLDDDGKEIDLGENNYFKTLQVPSYDIKIDKSKYDKANEEYNLSFKIDNPNEYLIEAILICENDKTLNQSTESSNGIFNFTLPTNLYTYRLELYQEDYLVGETTFNDYEGIEIIDESLEIGISSIDMALRLGEVDPNDMAISIINNDNPEVIPLEVALDGYIMYISYYELKPENSYTLVINDTNRKYFSYFSYDFTTIPIPQYEISIDESSFDIESQNFDLTFNIDNPQEYLIEAILICENDKTLNQFAEFSNGIFDFTLPTILSTYRLELYQENYLVGQTTFNYFKGIEIIDESLVIGISSIDMALRLGDVNPNDIVISIINNDNPEEVIPLEVALDGDILYVRYYELKPENSYTLVINDANRPSFSYFSYDFTTIPIPQYEISIDESSFDIESQNYVLTFNIDNPNGYSIDVNLYCLNDETYDDYYLIWENSLTITLPTLYSEYRLDLSQEGHDVGSISFSYYTPMELVLDTLNITSTSFEVEVKLGDIPLDTFSAFLIPEDNQDNELELEIIPLDNSSRIRLSMGDLMSDTSYTLQIRDSFRSTTVYLNYAFNTLA